MFSSLSVLRGHTSTSSTLGTRDMTVSHHIVCLLDDMQELGGEQ